MSLHICIYEIKGWCGYEDHMTHPVHSNDRKSPDQEPFFVADYDCKNYNFKNRHDAETFARKTKNVRTLFVCRRCECGMNYNEMEKCFYRR